MAYTRTKEEIKIYQRKWEQEHPDLVSQYQKNYGQKLKIRAMYHYSNGELCCARCGINDIDVLCIDHINGGGNKLRAQLRYGMGKAFYRWLRQNDFPEGYQVLCFNCNMKKQLTEHC